MIIDGINFIEEEAEKYWTFSKSYKGDVKKETRYMVTSGTYMGALKRDGHYSRLIKDMNGNIRMQGRTRSVSGEYLDKHEWVPQLQSFFDALPNGTCLLGELYFPNQKGSRKVTTILGCLQDKAIQRQEKGEKLNYYVFDVWAYDGKSFLETPIEKRIECLNDKINPCAAANDYVNTAIYYEGPELWDKLGEYLNNGEEGIVITKKGTCPEPGKRTARKTLKIKQEINQTIDAFLTGEYKPATREYNGKEIQTWSFWENIRTGEKFNTCKYDDYCAGAPVEPITKAYFYGWASSVGFGVYKDGKIERIAWISGITDDLKRDIVDKTDELKFKVAELSAMEIEHIDGGYSLRHGKIIQWRNDKVAEDCDFSQIG